MPAITSIALTIGGSAVSLDTVRLNEIELFNRDDTRRMTFVRESVLPEDDAWLNDRVELAINGTTVFVGTVRTRDPIHSDETGISYAYTVTGIEGHGDDWPVVSPFDGTTTVTFNQSVSDPGYDPTYDGLSLGEMIRTVLEEPSTREYLKTFDIGKFTTGNAIDSRTIADLEAGFLDEYRPAKPVTFQGDNLFATIRGILQSGCPNYRMWFQCVTESPPGGGTPRVFTIIRFADIRTVATTKTIDLSQHPAPQLRLDTANSFTRVVVRGGPDTRPVILDLSEGDLAEFFRMPPWFDTEDEAKTTWNIGVWLNGDRKQIKGTCLCRRPRTSEEADPGDPAYIADPNSPLLADPNWLYVDPEDNALTWGVDDWNQSSSGMAGFLYVTRSPVTDWLDTVNRRVVYNSALVASGKAYLQLDDPLPHLDYDKFTLIPGISPGMLTWRRYSVERLTALGESIAKYAQAIFPRPIPWMNTDGTPLSWTQAAVAAIYYTPEGSDQQQVALCGVQVDRLNEAIILDRPSVMFFGQPGSLEVGGTDVDGQPENIRVLIPVALSPLEAVAPEDDDGDPVYEGTAHTADGISRTLTIGQNDWISENDTGPMRLWARQILDSVKDTVVEGQATAFGYEPVFEPGTAIEWVDPCYGEEQPYERYTTLVYSCLLRFDHNGPVPYRTDFAVSNRRDQYRGNDPTLHPVAIDPIRPMKPTDVRVGSLISRSAGQWTGGGLGIMRSGGPGGYVTKLDK